MSDAIVSDGASASANNDPHWNEEAQALITGIILFIITAFPHGRCNLIQLRILLTLPAQDFSGLLRNMAASTAINGLVARAANRHLSKSDREASAVLSTVQRHTHFLDSSRMEDCLCRSDFSFADLKHKTVTVFLILPPERLANAARWMRLLITQSLNDLTKTAPVNETKDEYDALSTGTRPSVLYLLDEFASLGRLTIIERAFGLMAGYGVQLWVILQDIYQLRATYGSNAGTFLSNAGVLQIFGVNDHETAKFVSDLLGEQTLVYQTVK